MHIDIKHLPKLQIQDGERRKRYLFVAIDRCSRFVHLAVKDDETEKSAIAFLREAAAAFPFQLTHVLTDNGSCFTPAFATVCAKLGAQYSIERARHLLWHGRQEQADQELVLLLGHRLEIAARNGELHQASANDLRRLCTELRAYARRNCDAIVNYHRHYHDKRPVSTSRAEGCVDEIANARMGRKQRMRWSPRGARHVARVRAAVLDGRFRSKTIIPLAG